MKTVVLLPDPMDPTAREEHEVDDVLAFLLERFRPEAGPWRLPEFARIYHGQVAQSCDVTPTDEEGILRLSELPGPFYVIVYPGAQQIVIAAIMFVVSLAVSYALRPQLPSPRKGRHESPNNELSGRQNQARVGARVPDIFGRVRSVPDLLAVPYSTFEAHEEVEHSLLCVGRGAYEIHDMKDGQTRVDQIRGASVEVYGPHELVPGVPQADGKFGDPIPGPVLFPMRSAAVTGQSLSPQKDETLEAPIFFEAPNLVRLPDGHSDTFERFGTDAQITIAGAGINREGTGTFTARFWYDNNWDLGNYEFTGGLEFAPGQALPGALSLDDIITIAPHYPGSYVVKHKDGNRVWLERSDTPGAPPPWWGQHSMTFAWFTMTVGYPLAGTVIDLSGTYSIKAAGDMTLELDSPASVNAAWAAVSAFPEGRTPQTVATLSQTGPRYRGPFVIEYPNFTALLLNFIAERGLFTIGQDGKQYAVPVTLRAEVQRLDIEGAPWEPYDCVIQGSAATRRARAATLEIRPPWATGTHPGKCQVRVHRVTGPFKDTDGVEPDTTPDVAEAVDDVSWRDLYALTQHPGTSFGDVTVIRSVQRANAGTFALKERRLNALVTRKLPRWAGSAFTTTLYPTRDAADILCALCLDSRIGRRTLAELDVANIYATVAKVKAHFANQAVVTEFSYTFDDVQTSFEEAVSAVASAAFCTAYRLGSQIRLKADLPTEDSVLLFNHRNTVPGSETRTVRFGRKNAHNGVEFEYVSPADDAVTTIAFPADRSATNPERISSVGVRSKVQAYYHAARAWNRQRYQNTAVEFTGLHEAELLTQGDRILKSDGTRPETLDGEVRAQDGLTLTLSQRVWRFDPENSAFTYNFPIIFRGD